MRALAVALLLLTVPLVGCLGGDGDEPVRKARADVSSDLGGIEGLVTDTAIQPVIGANVTIVETNETTRTQEDGSFAFSNVQPGRYELAVSARGYVSSVQEVVVRADEVAIAEYVLATLFTVEPFTQQWELAGFFECGFGAGYNLSAAPAPANLSGGIITIAVCAVINDEANNATNDRFNHVIDAEAPLDTLIVETVWQSGLGGFSDQLWVDVVPEPHPCGSIVTCEWTYLDHWGPSPLRGQVDRDRFEHVQAWYDEQCAEGEDTWCNYAMTEDGWPLMVRVFPRWECTPAGPQSCLLLQQSFTHYVSAFYNAPAPAGFSAIA